MFNNDNDVPTELAESRFSTLMPIVLVAFGQISVGIIASLQTADPAFIVITALSIVVTAIRLAVIIAYHHRSRNSAGVAVWQRRYQIGSYAAATLVGALALRSFTVGNAEIAMMGNAVAFGYACGVVARGAIPPRWAFAGITLVTVPIIIGCLTHVPEPTYVCMAILVSIFYVGSFDVIRTNYELTRTQIRLKRQYEEMAKYDPLTGLRNRSALTEISTLVGSGNRTAVHYLDLDRFKSANDLYGHPVGDALLKEVAKRLQVLTGVKDMAVRLGGDEFLVVQANVVAREDAERLAERLGDAIATPFVVDDQAIHLGVSIGIAMAPEDGLTAQALLARADSALYASKRAHGDFTLVPKPPSLAPSHGINLKTPIEFERRV
jgi:diguanylate cyclase (GGDEF)-like protein